MPNRKRTCPACNESKRRSDFYIRKNGKPGGYCKPCSIEKERQRHRKRVMEEFGSEELACRDKTRRLRDSVKRGQSLCNRCLEIKSTKEFYGKSGKLDSMCIPCRRSYDKQRAATSPRNRLMTLLCAARNRARKEDREFDLTIRDLLGLWDCQEGICFYTGVKLRYDGTKSPEALSIDRRDNDIGYLIGNVVLCCRRVNEMKREMSLSELVRWCELIISNQERSNGQIQ